MIKDLKSKYRENSLNSTALKKNNLNTYQQKYPSQLKNDKKLFVILHLPRATSIIFI